MTSIFIGNLSFDATENDVRHAFEQYGRVSSVRVLTDRETGRSKGCAFVGMSHLDDADEAIRRLNGSVLGGRKVVVNEARSSGQSTHSAHSHSPSRVPAGMAQVGKAIPWDLF
jgi:RNA recognition motif-containing protein